MSKLEAVSKFNKFFNSLTKRDRLAIFYHLDGDGICSGIIAYKLAENKGVVPTESLGITNTELTKFDIVLHTLKKHNINKVIFVDLPVEQHPDFEKKIKDYRVLALDHHQSSRRINFVIKSQDISKNPEIYPASKLIYDLAGIKELDWVALLGLTSDISYDRWRAFAQKILRKNKMNKKQLYDIVYNINYADILRKDRDCFNKILDSKSLKELAPKLEVYSVIRDEAEYWLKNASKFAEKYGDLVLYEIKTKYSLASMVSTELSLRDPHKTIVIYLIRGNMVQASARRQDRKVSMHELMKKAVEGLPDSSGGGHIPAAGAQLRKEDLDKFKQNIIRLLSCKPG